MWSQWLLLIASILIFSLYTCKTYKCWRLVWQLNGWRGVAQQPIFWILLFMFLEPNSILNTTSRLRKYFQRPLAIIVGMRVLLYADDPRTLEQIFNSNDCLDKTFMQEGFFARRGLLHAKGQKWRIRRKQLNPTFNNSILLNFFDVYNLVGNQLQEKVSRELLGDETKFPDLEDLLSRAVLEVSCQTTMDTATNFTDRDNQGIAKTYKRLMDISALRIVKPWLQFDWLFRMLDKKNYELSIESNNLVEEFVDKIIHKKHLEWKEQFDWTNKDNENVNPSVLPDVVFNKDQNEPSRKRTFIEQLFHLASSGEMSLQEIMDESHSMILVSFETVSNSIIIALLCLATHPVWQYNLRKEIEETFPNGCAKDISANQLQTMKCLEMIVNETLRYLTTVPMNMRNVSKDFKLNLQNGFSVTVPQNTIVVLDPFNMQRDEDVWGSKAQDFHPEHFLSPNPDRHPYAYAPFSKGLRWCIGSRYSIFLMKIFLIKLVNRFEFKSDTDLKKLHFVEGISLKFRNPENIVFHIREVEDI